MLTIQKIEERMNFIHAKRHELPTGYNDYKTQVKIYVNNFETNKKNTVYLSINEDDKTRSRK